MIAEYHISVEYLNTFLETHSIHIFEREELPQYIELAALAQGLAINVKEYFPDEFDTFSYSFTIDDDCTSFDFTKIILDFINDFPCYVIRTIEIRPQLELFDYKVWFPKHNTVVTYNILDFLLHNSYSTTDDSSMITATVDKLAEWEEVYSLAN